MAKAIDGQDVVADTVEASVSAAAARQSERENQVGVPMDLPVKPDPVDGTFA